MPDAITMIDAESRRKAGQIQEILRNHDIRVLLVKSRDGWQAWADAPPEVVRPLLPVWARKGIILTEM